MVVLLWMDERERYWEVLERSRRSVEMDEIMRFAGNFEEMVVTGALRDHILGNGNTGKETIGFRQKW